MTQAEAELAEATSSAAPPSAAHGETSRETAETDSADAAGAVGGDGSATARHAEPNHLDRPLADEQARGVVTYWDCYRLRLLLAGPVHAGIVTHWDCYPLGLFHTARMARCRVSVA